MSNKIVSRVRDVAQRSNSVLAWATYTALNRERMVIKKEVKYAKLIIVECSLMVRDISEFMKM